jgi:hypothetical protein
MCGLSLGFESKKKSNDNKASPAINQYNNFLTKPTP